VANSSHDPATSQVGVEALYSLDREFAASVRRAAAAPSVRSYIVDTAYSSMVRPAASNEVAANVRYELLRAFTRGMAHEATVAQAIVWVYQEVRPCMHAMLDGGPHVVVRVARLCAG
jgi:hypothetical protein